MPVEFKMDLLIGVGASALAIFGQVDPSALPDWVKSLGPTGLCVWLVIHYTTVTIPRMEKRHMDERTAMLAIFEKSLSEKRADYKAELDQQRQDFRDELEIQRQDFAKMLEATRQ